ncbi:type VI secretion system spike protein VgrG1b [soil metagenome]
MAKTTQANRLMAIYTPLGEDYFLVNKVSASESISDLFSFEVELLHEEPKVGFAPTVVQATSIVGQNVTIAVEQRDGTKREFSGMVNRFSQGTRHARFSFYYATVVPHIWMLTQIFQSRIFQQKSVPDILKIVFQGFDVSWEIQGTFEPRNYCVQYRESDFDFASRLMEEEGIYYYFEHADGKHKLVVANTPQSNRDCPSKSTIPFFLDVSRATEDFVTSITSWQTDYQLQTGKVTLWDHNFQLPGKKLEADKPSIFNVGENQNMEYYDFPAGYARKYDGISKDGGEQAGELQKIFEDNHKTAEVRMQALDGRYKTAIGSSDCSSLIAGYRFSMTRHPNSSENGKYVITSIAHEIEQNPAYVSDDHTDQPYRNTFNCMAHGAGVPPFRPLRKTAKPLIYGSQTAIVVGPAGEEIFTDKYGRVKVQLHWDREGQGNAESSCWVRVAQAWAGHRWGMMFIPRIGMEVILHFLEGDPDQPIITGCVYNPSTMPPYTLPDEKTKMTIKSDSSKGGGGFNEIRFEDKKGSEQVFLHGQKDQDIRIRNTRRELIGNDRHLIVKRDKREKVERDEHIIIERDLIEKIERDYHLHVEGKMAVKIDGSLSNDVGGSIAEKTGGNYAMDASNFYTVKAKTIVLEADTAITLKVGGSSININAGGIQIIGSPMLMLNSGGAALQGMQGMIVSPLDPDEAEIADNADPGSKAPTYKNQRSKIPHPKIPTYTKPSHKPKSPTNKDKKSWIEIQLFDQDGDPVPGERYRVTLPDGKTIAEGTLDEKGFAKVKNIDPGNCKITFPRLDGRAWNKK